MSEWAAAKLGDHLKVLPGFPFQSDLFSTESGTPLIRIRDLLANSLETFYQGTFDEQFVVRDGDILIGMDGDFNVVRWNKGEALLNQRVCAVASASTALDDGFLYRILGPRIDEIHRITPQTTVKHLSTKDLRLIRLDLPSRPEQSAIARILDTLDTQIEKTQALIAKLEQVKEGLLHDLLTRGVDENGELRPSAEEAPELYKESALGLIPRGWRLARLDELATRVTDGTHQAVKTVPQGADAIPFLFVSCVRHGTIRWDGASAVSRKDYELISRGRETHAGMVLYTAVGSYGHAAVVDADVDFAFQRHIACISPREDLLLPAFLGYLLNSDSLRRHADQVALGNAQKTVTLGELSRFPITLPSVKEQAAISSRAGQLDLDLTALRRSETKLQIQKSGLMDDLLTGRVRVTPLLERDPAEAN